ncbi:L-2-hydroxyglutarate oxidase [Rubrivirga sp. IMCC43871]|uniref:L-2-hydroxyglutarate oxidase n=1 Tax=Rubrivirga sp. IMCC43871 TaxID=3391575 RepID=UPI0039903779
MRVDLAIVGGGLVGLGVARAALAARPGLRVVVLEKEDRVAAHQSGRNSGVLHAGVYYRPGSAKAAFCRAGKAQMEAFCEAEDLPVVRSGKTIVAVAPDEIPRLDVLAERAAANGVTVHRLDAQGVREHEPHVRAYAGLWVPATAVADFAAVAARLAQRLSESGAEVRTGVAVVGGRETADGVVVETSAGDVEARALVTCAGLWADRVARIFGAHPSVQLVPFRGEYALLRPHAADLVRGLIYPVPDPAFPFLGIHLTRRVDGTVDAGPSAALAFARDGYRLRDVRPADLGETLASPAFRRLARRHLAMGLSELGRSLSVRAFWRAARRLVPDLALADLSRGPSGVRAQALHPDGTLADDFVIEETARAVHVINAPSPAATASLAVGEHVAALTLAKV